MNKSQTQFLELLRAGLWGVAANPDNFKPGSVDWQAVLRIAKEQTMLVVVADGIEMLPQALWPPKDVMMKLVMMRVKTLQAHQLLNSTIAQIVNVLDAAGVPSVLMKGQGIAQNYRCPESRSCGDIDIYVGQENFAKTCEVIGAMSTLEDHQGDIPSLKHFHTRIGSAFIEIHRYTDVYFQRWRDRFYQKVSDHGMTCGLVPLDFGGVPVMSPSVDFNVFFIFNHFWHHFIADGVGLRQLCDWVRLLHECYGKIDLEYLSEVLRGMGLMKEWKVFGYIAVNTLGLPAQEMPFYDVKYKKLAAKVLDLIMLEGNFGKENLRGHKRPKGYLAGKLYSFGKRFKRNLRVLRLFPMEGLRQLFKVFFVGIAVVLTDKFAKYED